MAFPVQNREFQNRRILEDLQFKKQQLIKQGTSQSVNQNNPSSVPPNGVINVQGDSHSVSSMQHKASLISAHSQSFGFFVGQDSSFGNCILPVIPRI